MDIPYYGESMCGATYASGVKKGQGCGNYAYYLTNDRKIRCGVHSKKDQRKELAKNPNAAKNKKQLLADRQELCVKEAQKNNEKGVKGEIICAKLRMRQEAPHEDSYLKVFPNFKHDNREDGFGCKSLSPMSLGPIAHNQPGLPVSLNLENFHQGSKVFKSELLQDGTIGPDFFRTQLEMFQDPIPHRHKEVAKEIKGNKNICHSWVWKRQDGTMVEFQYVQCRQFYCNYYERLATQQENFTNLMKLRDAGYNLMIVGYDGRDVREIPGTTMAEKLETCYLDASKPFGHELCLLALLTLTPEEYPWRKHKTEDF